ncbi:MAG: PhzF family phenazine biosynthesis protein [Flavonifractor plautii]
MSTGLLDILSARPGSGRPGAGGAERGGGHPPVGALRRGGGAHVLPQHPRRRGPLPQLRPLYAIPEEAATGTSNGALTYYLYRRGLTAAGAENRFVQGEKMGKPSEILSRLTDGGDGVKVQVGGRAVLALRCELL